MLTVDIKSPNGPSTIEYFPDYSLADCLALREIHSALWWWDFVENTRKNNRPSNLVDCQPVITTNQQKQAG